MVESANSELEPCPYHMDEHRLMEEVLPGKHRRIGFIEDLQICTAIKEMITAWNTRAKAKQPMTNLVHIYNSGYLSGHHDTVEGVFTDIYYNDLGAYHEDEVAELVDDLGVEHKTEPIAVVDVWLDKDQKNWWQYDPDNDISHFVASTGLMVLDREQLFMMKIYAGH